MNRRSLLRALGITAAGVTVAPTIASAVPREAPDDPEEAPPAPASRRATNYPLLERGVYRTPYLTAAGSHILFAISSTARLVREIEVPEDGDAMAVNRELWRELDRLDPV